MTVVASNYARKAKRGEAQAWLGRAKTYSDDDCLLWPFWRSQDGYARATIRGRKTLVSRYLCEAIHGAAPSVIHQAAHSCGRGQDGCVNPRHLRWATPSENTNDKLAHGTLVAALPGRENFNGKLTDADVIEIRRLFGSLPQVFIARRFGISQSNVSAIGRRETWGHLP